VLSAAVELLNTEMWWNSASENESDAEKEIDFSSHPTDASRDRDYRGVVELSSGVGDLDTAKNEFGSFNRQQR